MQLTTLYLIKKLYGSSLELLDLQFRKTILNMFSGIIHIQLSKSFTNFTGTAYQLCRQKLVSFLKCGMCNREHEEDTLHVLYCSYHLFSLYRNEIVSILQLMVLGLLEENMFPFYFLLQMLDNNEDNIEMIPDHIMTSLNLIERRNIWFSFLPSTSLQQFKWRYESTKWLGKFIVLYIKAFHRLWLERYKIVHESMASRVKVEDH